MVIYQGEKQKIIIVGLAITAIIIVLLMYFFVFNRDNELNEYFAWCDQGFVSTLNTEDIEKFNVPATYLGLASKNHASLFDGETVTYRQLGGIFQLIADAYENQTPPDVLKKYHNAQKDMFDAMGGVLFLGNNPAEYVTEDAFLSTILSPDVSAIVPRIQQAKQDTPEDVIERINNSDCPKI